MALDENYMSICQEYLAKLNNLEDNNLNYIRSKLGLESELFKKMISKVDKDYFQAIGLGRRLELPKDLTVEEAKMLKLKIQERVMELWNLNQEKVFKVMDMYLLLQILECYAEDEVFLSNNEIEIEQIERLIASEYDQDVAKEVSIYPAHSNTISHTSIQKALRMNMFVIAEEEYGSEDADHHV